VSWSSATAKPERRPLEVTANERVGSYRLLRVHDPDGGCAPGQFAMLAAEQHWGGGQDERPFLPRALSVARHRGGEAHFLLEDVGPGTSRLCELAPGERVFSVGPLGRGFRPPQPGRRALLVGGGVGIAPLMILQDRLAAATRALLGFRDGERARAAELMLDVHVATDDGSVGHRGTVAELLRRELEEDREAEVFACGPGPMLEAVRALCSQLQVPAQLALEAPMACGFGACFGCVVPARDGSYLRVCVDGPVIDAEALGEVGEYAGAPA